MTKWLGNFGKVSKTKATCCYTGCCSDLILPTLQVFAYHLLELLTARNDPSVFPMFLSAFSVAAVRGRRRRTLSHSKSSVTGHTEYMRRWRQRIKEDPTMYRRYLEKQSESGRRHRAKKKTALVGSSTFQLGKSRDQQHWLSEGKLVKSGCL